MYARIALGNVRKSFRDFSVFFLTLAFGVCVFYAFGSITDQAAVIQMAADQRRKSRHEKWCKGLPTGVSLPADTTPPSASCRTPRPRA